jgi:hypothetical protein
MQAILVPADLVLKGHGYEAEAASLLPTTAAYLLQNGWTQAHGDAKAVTAKDTEGMSEDEVKALKAERLAAKHDAIMAGTVGTRNGGPRLVGIDKMIQIVAMEEVVAWAASKGKKLPTGKGAAEKLRASVESYMANATRAEKVRAKAQERIDSQKQAVEALGEDDFDFETAA